MIRPLFATFALATSLLAASAHATVVTSVSTGTITNVTSALGYFSDISVGQSYTFTLSVDRADLTESLCKLNTCGYSYLTANGWRKPYSAELTINGQSYALQFGNTATSGFYLGNSASVGGSYNDSWSSSLRDWGYNDGVLGSISTYIYDSPAFTGTLLDFGLPYEHTSALQRSGMNYSISGANGGYASIAGAGNFFAFNPGSGASDIPEPASLALFALGLLGVVAAKRRKAVSL